MDAVWLNAPIPAIRLFGDAREPQWQANPALHARVAGVPPAAREGAAALLRAACARGEAAPIVAIGPERFRGAPIALDVGWLVWLEPLADAYRDDDGWSAQMLHLAQEFGRMAVVDIDLLGTEHRWSHHALTMWGFEGRSSAPGLEEAFQRVHPDDLPRVREAFALARSRVGAHEAPFRLVRPGGEVREVHGFAETIVDAAGQPARLRCVVIDDTDVTERVREQKAALRELLRAVELAGVSVWRVDLATNRIMLNEIGYAAVGMQPRAGGVPIDEFRRTVHPDDLAELERARERALDGDAVVEIETRYRDGSGQYRSWLTRRVAELGADGRPTAYLGISIEQSKRVAERERAMALARRIEFITRSAGIGVWSIDPATGQAEWDAQTRRIYGIAPEAPLPTLRWLLRHTVHPEDRARVLGRWPRDGDAGVQREFRILLGDGSVRWVSSWARRERVNGRVAAFGVTMDITERMRAQQRLRAADDRARIAAESAGIGTFERDFDNGDSTWDAQMFRLRGLAPVPGQATPELRFASRHPEDAAEVDQAMHVAMEQGRDFEAEFRVIWPDGSVHWIASRGIPRRDGGTRRMVGVNWDITERKRVEQALREKERAEQASRAKSEFLARMSHELRTPLNAVLGFAQLLAHDEEAPLSRAQGQRVERIRTAGQHLLALIDDVLDLASIESNSLPLAVEPVSLRAAIDEVIQWNAPLAERRDVTLRALPTPAWVRGDPRRVRQVLTNLVNNAIKYNRPLGFVQLQVRATAHDGQPAWEVQVEDSGRGLDDRQRSQLFEPFNRLGVEREGIEGTGIGLAISHHLVALMGGRIVVQSEPGRGSVFSVVLPAAAEAGAADDRQAAAPDAAEATLPAAPTLDVLYIEDNPVNVLLVQQLVGMRPNVQLATATTGGAGVAAAVASRPHVVLVDMQLPDFDGFEVLRRLRAHPRTAGCTVIALSANAMPEDIRRARESGFEDYWTKPIDFRRFLAALDALAEARAV